MNVKMKRRMIVVTGIIVMVLVVILAVVGGSSTAKSISLAEAASGSQVDQKVQVTGNVVENSFKTEDNVLTFEIYDASVGDSVTLPVRYEGGVSATFGNDVTAICTGKMGADGVLNCSQLVTKCPSKYEDSSSALTLDKLLAYGEEVIDKPVKVSGVVKAGSLAAATADQRFVLVDPDTKAEIPVLFDGALSEEIADESALVVTGSLTADNTFMATDVALQG